MRGIHKGVADGISRWDRDSVLVNLRAARPDVPWQMRDLGDAGNFGVGLELMRVAVAPSSERTYQGHFGAWVDVWVRCGVPCLLYTSPSPRDLSTSRMPSSA